MNPILAAGLFLAGVAFFLSQCDSKAGVKRSHDEWFSRWLTLKNMHSELEQHKRALYSHLKSNALTRSEKKEGHQQLARLKEESVRLREMKHNAHNQWRAYRTSLLR